MPHGAVLASGMEGRRPANVRSSREPPAKAVAAGGAAAEEAPGEGLAVGHQVFHRLA